jgi:hypothetical protein
LAPDVAQSHISEPRFGWDDTSTADVNKPGRLLGFSGFLPILAMIAMMSVTFGYPSL